MVKRWHPRRILCFFWIHDWQLFWFDLPRGYQERCTYCNKPRRKQ